MWSSFRTLGMFVSRTYRPRKVSLNPCMVSHHQLCFAALTRSTLFTWRFFSSRPRDFDYAIGTHLEEMPVESALLR
jgi:hypothetical protein